MLVAAAELRRGRKWEHTHGLAYDADWRCPVGMRNRQWTAGVDCVMLAVNHAFDRYSRVRTNHSVPLNAGAGRSHLFADSATGLASAESQHRHGKVRDGCGIVSERRR
jgi:hypothetical protein